MKSVLISIQPKWCELIASGKKTIEVRKTRPKNDTPFKCYIYQTKMKWIYDILFKMNLFGLAHKLMISKGKVMGEFVCDRIQPFESEFVDDDCYEFVASLDYDEDGDATGFIEWSNDSDFSYESTDFYKKCCVKYEELKNYMGQGINEFYGWHISDLVIYDKPKELSEFKVYEKTGCPAYLNGVCVEKNHRVCLYFRCENLDCQYKELTKPPQSWCYVEGGGEE